MTIDPIPQVRIVRHAGTRVAPPPAPTPEPLRIALTYAIGLWPLVCVGLLVAGLLIFTANLGAP